MLALSVAACGSAGGSETSGDEPEEENSATGGQAAQPADGFDTGLPDDKRSSELTPTELDRVCNATRDYIESSVAPEDVCRTLAAVSSAQDDEPVAACEAAYAECLDQRDGAPMLPCAVTDECDVSVAEYEACIEAFVTTAAPIVTQFPACEDVTQLSLLPLLGLLELPDCQGVRERCGLPFPEP